jgi:hypothetical protein
MQSLEKAVGSYIDFYSISYYNRTNSFSEYIDLFGNGPLSLQTISKNSVNISKIVISKPSNRTQTGYINPSKLLEFSKKASYILNWNTGVSFHPFIAQQSID